MLKILQDQLVTKSTFCGLPFTKMILNSWGDVSMCCHQVTQLGRLTEDVKLLDLWNSSLAWKIRKETEEGNLHPVCKSWNSCPFLVSEKYLYDVTVHEDIKYPLYIEICLPDKHCNVGGESPNIDNPACIMCRRNFHVPDQIDITDFLCKKVRPLMPHLRHVCVLGIAEPFWKDAVFKILNKLNFRKYKHQCQFRTNTNGICLNEKTIKKFFDEVEQSNVSWSIDAATAITHRKIRRLDTFDLVVDNLKNWIKMRGSKTLNDEPAHVVSIYNNINMLNVHEMTQMVEMAHEVGVDAMYLLPTHDQAGVVQLGELVLCEKNVKIFKEESERAWETATRLGVDLIYPTRFDIIPPSNQSLVQLKV
jgi:hypothetical protein